tara:strand:+ start:217 stop:444 length:228 start_codon:yes stop_codon:yes gene_type:complete
LRGLVDNLSRGHLGGVIDRSLAEINHNFEFENESAAEYSGGEGENDASRGPLVSKKKKPSIEKRALNKRSKGQIS